MNTNDGGLVTTTPATHTEVNLVEPGPAREPRMVKVLVADDEKGIRELLADTLGEAGYDVIEASDGAEALDMASKEHPDIILMDVIMPVMDGLQALGKLRESPSTESIPVILLTAMSAVKGEADAMKMGVTHYLTKPWQRGTVELAIKVALRESTAADGEVVSDDGPVIKTGNAALDQILGGGVPLSSLTLIEGTSSAGKSVLCQHLTYESLRRGHGAAYFTSGTTSKDLIAQMSSIGMDVSAYLLEGDLRIYSVEETAPGDGPDESMALLAAGIQGLESQHEVIIVDSISSLASYSQDRAILEFFSTCKRLCEAGRTIIVVAHPYAFNENMLRRLRTLSDGYLSLSVEKIGAKLVKSLEVRNMHNAELHTANTITFQVVQGSGIRVVPSSRVQV